MYDVNNENKIGRWHTIERVYHLSIRLKCTVLRLAKYTLRASSLIIESLKRMRQLAHYICMLVA